MKTKKIKVFLGGYVNCTNAQNLNCRALAKYLDKDEAEYYTQTAKRLLKAIIDNCAVKDSKESNGLLLHGTYAKKTAHNTCNNGGVDECNTWGDYFYMEALTRLTSDWDPYWF